MNLKAFTIRAKTDSKGFTLLEILVAMLFISIVLTAVYRMHSQTISMNIASQFYTIAPLLAQQKLSELDMEPLKEKSGETGDFGDENAGYNWTLSIEKINPESLTEAISDVYKIDIKVSFNNDVFSYDLRTYKIDFQQ